MNNGQPKGNIDRYALKQVTDTLMDAAGAEAVMLFGSRARGDDDQGSDYDLCLIMPDSTRPGTLRLHEIYRLVAGMGLPLDLTAVTLSRYFEGAKEVNSLARQVWADGVVVAGSIRERAAA